MLLDIRLLGRTRYCFALSLICQFSADAAYIMFIGRTNAEVESSEVAFSPHAGTLVHSLTRPALHRLVVSQ